MNFSKKCGIIFFMQKKLYPYLSQAKRLPHFLVVSNSKFVSVGVRSPNEINALRIYYF